MLHWNWRSFQELSNTELYDVLSIREMVFVIEQKCPYIDLDFRDQHSMHLLGSIDNKLAAYLRVLPKGIAYPDAVSLGRVATAAFARGKGYGKELIAEALSFIEKNYTDTPIIISAQYYLERFYQSFGFKSIGEPYQEDDIPHIKMKKTSIYEK